MSNLLGAFFLAARLLTCLPFPMPKKDLPLSFFGLSVLFYPLVGFLIGAHLFFIAYLLTNTPPMLSSALILFSWCALTGGIHLDGYMDVLDAYFSRLSDPVQVKKIMHDPHVGSLSVVFTILLLLLKFSAIYCLINQAMFIFLFIPMLARSVLLFFIRYLPYQKTQGMGFLAYENLPKHLLSYLIGAMAILSFFLLGFLETMLIMMLAYFLRQKIKRWLDQMTGDVYGFVVEVFETFILLIMAFKLGA